MALEVLAEAGVCLLSLLTGFESSRIHARVPFLPTLFFMSGAALYYRYFLYTSSRLHLCVSLATYLLAYWVGKAFVCIGLTGGIACGKSSVVEVIQKRYPGVLIIDCDKVVRDLQRPGQPVFTQIVSAFGPEMVTVDGQLDRPRLARLIFSDEKARRRINAITHPAVMREIVWRLVVGRLKGYRHVVLDAPLLFETKVLQYFCFPIVCVMVTKEEMWVDRLVKRDSISVDEARAKISSQMPISLKAKQSHFVIDNTGDFEALEQRVKTVMTSIVGRE